MARERIITLRHLSLERKSPLHQARPERNSNRSCLSVSDDDQTAIDHGDSITECHSRLIIEPDHDGLQSVLATHHHHQLGKLEDEEEEDEEDMGLIKPRSSRLYPQSPYASVPKTDQADDPQSMNAFRSDLFRQTLDMGKFIDQATKLSNQLDLIECELNDHQPDFTKDQTYRLNLYQNFENNIIPSLIQLQATASLSDCHADEALDGSKNHLPTIQVDFHPPHARAEDCGNHDDFLNPITQHIGNPLKREQINVLASKINSIIYRLISLLNSERRMIANEIQFEWNKELSHCNISKWPTTHTDDSSDSESSSDHQEKIYADTTVLQMMGLDECSADAQDPLCKTTPDEIQKRIKLAVRSSTSYPQARKSSLIILSEFDTIQQIQVELEQLSRLIGLLSQHFLHRPQHNEKWIRDDASSASISLYGLDHDTATLSTYSKMNLTEKKVKRKETYRKSKFCSSNSRHPANDHEGISGKSEHNYDLENQCGYSSHYAHSHPPSGANPQCRWYIRYRTTLITIFATSLVLGSMAVALFLVLRTHDK